MNIIFNFDRKMFQLGIVDIDIKIVDIDII